MQVKWQMNEYYLFLTPIRVINVIHLFMFTPHEPFFMEKCVYICHTHNNKNDWIHPLTGLQSSKNNTLPCNELCHTHFPLSSLYIRRDSCLEYANTQPLVQGPLKQTAYYVYISYTLVMHILIKHWKWVIMITIYAHYLIMKRLWFCKCVRHRFYLRGEM